MIQARDFAALREVFREWPPADVAEVILDVPEDEAGKSYEFLVSHMPDNMIVDDAVIKQAMEFAASALKLKSDAVPDISKVRDWSYARAATR